MKAGKLRSSRSGCGTKGGEAWGITRVEAVVVLAVCLVLVGSLLPGVMRRARARSSRLNCVNNLKQIGLAFKTWSLDNSYRFPMSVSVTNGGSLEFVGSGQVFPHFQVMSNELSTPKILVCPDGLLTQRPATNWEKDLADGQGGEQAMVENW